MGRLTRLRRLIVAALVAVLIAVGVSAIAPASPAAADPVGDVACAAGNLVLPGVCGVGSAAADAASDAIDDAASSGFKGIVKSILQGTGSAMTLVLTWFVRVPTPEAAQYSAIQKVKDLTLRLQLIFMALSIVVGGVRLMLAKRHAVYAAGEEQFHALSRAVIGAWVFGGFLTALSVAVDALSVAWLGSVTDGDAAKVIARIVNVEVLTGSSGMATGFLLIVGILGALGAVFQAVVLVVRQAMLILVTAYIPIIGAASGTELGKAAYSRTVRWVLALLLWKLVASGCFVVAFTLAGDSDDPSAEEVFYGFILLFLSALMLPMMMKLVSAGLSMSGGSGMQAGMMAAGVVAAGGTLAAGGAGAGGAASTAGAAGATGAAGVSGGSGPAGAAAGGGSAGGGGVARMSSAAMSGGGGPAAGGGSGSWGGARSGGGSMAATSTVPSTAAMPEASSSGGASNRFSAASDAMGTSGVMSQAAENFFDGADDGMSADGGLR
ncbi:hypothetical protein [Gordonia tangerina]|uniref:TrbL/VirB6 plasmid conjugal transfer protein n=1 Tax=Gordonia tangerina TaxID=2911060 RepID=A0ABS9DNC1_9ACTN|nr:hypothetical protein [Gordonia tangerina]MCF3940652.1 hypothetical protein [Gordonia tangerina]